MLLILFIVTLWLASRSLLRRVTVAMFVTVIVVVSALASGASDVVRGIGGAIVGGRPPTDRVVSGGSEQMTADDPSFRRAVEVVEQHWKGEACGGEVDFEIA